MTRIDCTCCFQRPAVDPKHKDRATGLPLCEECYYGMDQTLDEQGNIYPEVLFYMGDDEVESGDV